MVYGSDITEGIPTPLSNPAGGQNYAATGVAFDIAIAGQPFFLATNDEQPYRRVTAQYRKQQLDTTREPGEQTLTGWWLRSQSTFHLGQGIKYFEPQQDESLRFQYSYSKGCDVWTKGQVSLLRDTNQGHITTGQLASTGRAVQIIRSINWKTGANTYNGCLLWDQYDVDKIFDQIDVVITNKALTSNVATLTTQDTHKLSVGMQITVAGVDSTFNGEYRITSVPTTTSFTYAKTATNVPSTAVSPTGTGSSNLIHFIDYNSGSADAVRAICDDGVYAYWVTNNSTSNKFEIWKKLLTDDSVTSAGTLMATSPSVTAGNAVMEYIKERIVLCVNNQVFELPTSTTSWSQVITVYTHPTNDYIYTSIAASGPAIYTSGFSGIQSTIQKYTLVTDSGSMPVLTQAITAAELPAGETSYSLFYYLGYIAIGTSKGVRIADINPTDGSLSYGPLLFESSQPVYDFAAYDRFLWAATSVEGEPGVTRIDLGQQIGSSLVFAYAWDLYFPGVTGHDTTSCAFLGTTNQLAFVTAATSSEDGSVYTEDISTLVQTGELRTGYIRYNTLENKIFKLLTPRCDTTNGGISIISVDENAQTYTLGTFAQGSYLSQVGISYPAGPQQFLGFQFSFTRSNTDVSKGPMFTGYQVNTLASIPRQRLIQYPIELYDSESDKFNNPTGYEGYAFNRLQTMQNIEDVGDLVRIEDFRTGESYLGLIEEMDFINRTPTDKRYSGYGGLLLVTIRTA